jgi:hypothetical protein
LALLFQVQAAVSGLGEQVEPALVVALEAAKVKENVVEEGNHFLKLGNVVGLLVDQLLDRTEHRCQYPGEYLNLLHVKTPDKNGRELGEAPGLLRVGCVG